YMYIPCGSQRWSVSESDALKSHAAIMMRRREFLRSLAAVAGIAVLPAPWFSVQADDTPFDVYLTFDDGPFPAPDLKTGPTDVVIQTLKDHKAWATFFLHGRHILKWHGP